MTLVCSPRSYPRLRQATWKFLPFLCGFARIFLFMVVITAATSPSFAQQFATLNLTVTDPSGSVIPQANVSVQNIDTGVIRTALSDKLGLVQIPGLPAGQYTLKVDAGSFSPYQAPLTLTVGQIASLQIGLGIRAATEQVEVREATQGVDRERTQTSQVIDPRQIADLPIPDRDFIDFVLLSPTATIGRDFTTGAQSAFQETVRRSASEACAKRTLCSTAWMESMTQLPFLEFSARAHLWTGFRSSAWSRDRTLRMG